MQPAFADEMHSSRQRTAAAAAASAAGPDGSLEK